MGMHNCVSSNTFPRSRLDSWEQLHNNHCESTLTRLETTIDVWTTSILNTRRQQQLTFAFNCSWQSTQIRDHKSLLSLDNSEMTSNVHQVRPISNGRLNADCVWFDHHQLDQQRLGIRGEYEWYIYLARDAEIQDVGQANASRTRDALDNLMHKRKWLKRGDITTTTRDRLEVV